MTMLKRRGNLCGNWDAEVNQLSRVFDQLSKTKHDRRGRKNVYRPSIRRSEFGTKCEQQSLFVVQNLNITLKNYILTYCEKNNLKM